MFGLIGYVCSDDSLTPAAMHKVRGELGGEERNGDFAALGFGWVQENRSLLRKHPNQENNGIDVLGLLSDIPARAIVGYVQEDDGFTDTLDLQPFRFRNWVYAQDDSLTSFEESREELTGDIPDHIRRNIQGNNRAEVAFHRFLYAMHTRDQLGQQRPDGREAAMSLARAASEFESIDPPSDRERPVEMQAVTATQRLLLALNIERGMYYRVFEGIEEPTDDPLFAGHRPKPETHPHFKAVFLATGELEPSEEWNELGEREIFWVDQDWKVHTEGLDALIEDDEQSR